MAVRTTEEILELLRTRMGDDTSDEALSLLEDISDTMAELQTKESEDWKSRYEENDKMWREKYRERFFSKPDTEEPNIEEKNKKMSYDDLFEETEEK